MTKAELYRGACTVFLWIAGAGFSYVAGLSGNKLVMGSCIFLSSLFLLLAIKATYLVRQ